MFQATDGASYGTGSDGGANGDGSLCTLSVGFGTFGETLATSGQTTAAVEIPGTNLPGCDLSHLSTVQPRLSG
jgi:hypothetical protein